MKKKNINSNDLNTDLLGELKRIDWCLGKSLITNVSVTLGFIVLMTIVVGAIDLSSLYLVREFLKLFN